MLLPAKEISKIGIASDVPLQLTQNHMTACAAYRLMRLRSVYLTLLKANFNLYTIVFPESDLWRQAVSL